MLGLPIRRVFGWLCFEVRIGVEGLGLGPRVELALGFRLQRPKPPNREAKQLLEEMPKYMRIQYYISISFLVVVIRIDKCIHIHK